MHRIFASLILVSANFFFTPQSAWAITFTTLDHPLGVNGTVANGTDGGKTVGSYTDSFNLTHGFLYDGSTFTTIDAPVNGVSTYAQDISGNTVVGYYANSQGVSHSFSLSGSTYTLIPDPMPITGAGTYALGISGTNVVGWANVDDFGGDYGFLYNGSSFPTLPFRLYFTGIDGGNIVGYELDASFNYHGFLLQGSTHLVIDDPLGVHGTFPKAIFGNSVVGTYEDASNHVHGFLYNGSTYATIDDPLGVGGTSLNGISATMIAGAYFDPAGNSHGFITQIPEPSSLALAGLGFVGLAAWGWRRRKP